MSPPRILIYLLRRDLRLADNPAFHEISKAFQQAQHPATHLLPLYVFSAQQVEVSGFLSSADQRSPFPEARSQVGGFWRCGQHRAKFLAESVWDLKTSLESVGSGLVIRVGTVGQVVKDLIDGIRSSNGEIVGVWMTGEEGVEEKREEREVRRIVEDEDKEFRLWRDEKYFLDDRDLPFKNPQDLPDIFTSFRKTVEPLRAAPRSPLPTPSKLLPLPSSIPEQSSPFEIPSSLDETISNLLRPLESDLGLKTPPAWPKSAISAHPFRGGSTTGHDRIQYLISSGNMTTYKASRNGLLGTDFSTKLSSWLALGSITARQIHADLLSFEDGTNDIGKGAKGYGKGENEGTAAVRFELLWRDYMRLCTRKFGPRLFRVTGFREDEDMKWKHADKDPSVSDAISRFLSGTTGIGLIDASMRELYLTGYTSNRARQNVASFLAKHLGIDWRIGAEWYESLLCDYDVSSNWGNWQYTAGVGNDPRGEARIFNPVKQAFDYDPQGEYVKTWVPELQGIEDPQVVFQAWKMSDAERKARGLEEAEWVRRPLKKIDFQVLRGAVGKRGGGGRRSGGGWNGNANHAGGQGQNGGHNHNSNSGTGFADSARGRGSGQGRAGGYYRGRGRGSGRGPEQGQQGRMGAMDKAQARGVGVGVGDGH